MRYVTICLAWMTPWCAFAAGADAPKAGAADKFAAPEARQLADNMLLWQRDSGGWPKNVDMAGELDEAARARLKRDKARGDATFDNGATHRQIQHLARVYSAARAAGAPPEELEPYRQAVLRGIDYVLANQHPNGGWPQVSPRSGGYAKHVTFNDGAMIGVLGVVRDAALRRPHMAFVDAPRVERCRKAMDKGIECILACQVVASGKRTAWGQQHHFETLKPAAARAFEPASLCTAESVGVVRFLMEIETPAPEVVAAVEGACAWLEEVKITGVRQEIVPAEPVKFPYHTSKTDKRIVQDAAAPPIWTRLYEIGTNRPIFGDRDGKVHYTLAEISRERRTGYDWYGRWPAKLLTEDLPAWRKRLGKQDG